jgi:hypothetical protein
MLCFGNVHSTTLLTAHAALDKFHYTDTSSQSYRHGPATDLIVMTALWNQVIYS